MKKTFKPSTAAALVTVLTFAVTGGGWAAGMGTAEGPGTAGGMDTMSSGKTLTKEELRAFSQLDTNNDGKISQEEAKKNPNLAIKFDSVDSNHDSAVDEGEFAQFETDIENK